MRSKSFSIVLLILCCLFVIFPSGQAHAEEKTGYWLFTGAEKEDTSGNIDVYEEVNVDSEVEYGGVKVTMVYDEEIYGIKKGTKRTIVSSWTTPESKYGGEDTVSLDVTLSCKDNTEGATYFSPGNFNAKIIFDNRSSDYFRDSEGSSYYNVGEEGSETYSEKFSCNLRAGKEEGDKMEIEISCTGGKVTYTYKWIDTTPQVKCRWNLKDTQTEGARIVLSTWNNYGSKDWEVKDPNDVGSAMTRYIHKVSPGSFSTNYTAIQSLYSATFGQLMVPAGFSATSTCTYTEPRDTYYAGDLMELTLTANGVYTTVECDFDDKSWTMDTSIGAYVSYTSAKSLDEAKSHSSSNHTWLEYEKGEDTVRSSKEAHSNTKKVSVEVEDASYYGPDSENQSYMVLKVNSNSGSMTVSYIYQWEAYENVNPDSGAGQEIPVPGGSDLTVGDDDSLIDKIHDEVFKDAKNTPGEDEGTNIPAAIFVTAAGGVAAAGAAGAASGKKKKKDKKKSTFKLAVNKNFGNTIRKQGAPVYVYARIIEVTPEGHEKTREDLSANIQIYAGSAGIEIEDAGMTEGYRAARAFAPKSQETECIIAFRFNYEGNSFTENVRFFLEEPAIHFYQENLAWPAKCKDPAELPFTLVGFNPENCNIEIRMSEGSPYDAQLVPSENDPETFWAVLSDICTKDQEAGTVAESFLIVTVSDNELSVEERFPVSRVGLGLTFAMPALNCYRVPKKSAEGKKIADLSMNDFEAATTVARTMLILFDDKQKRIVQLPANPKFELTPILNDDISKERIDALGMKTRLMKVEEGYSEVIFYCEKGWLEPPVRLRMNIKATWDYGEGEEKKTYICEKPVLMRSQPLRKYQNEDMRTKEYQNDREISEKLDRMTDMIIHNNWFEELAELYAEAYLMRKYYSDLYGYDAIKVAQVLGAFNEALGFRQQRLEAIAERDNYRADKKRDGLIHEIAFRAKALDSFPIICARIALAVGTAGASEIILTPLDIIKSGVEYTDENLPREQTTWGKLWAGVKPLVLNAVIGAGLKYGTAGAVWLGNKTGVTQAAKKVVPVIARYTLKPLSKISILPKSLKNEIKEVGKYFDEMAERVDDCDPRSLKGNAAAAEEAMEKAILQGKNAADDILKNISGDLTQLEKLEELALKAGNKEGSDLLKGLKAAIDNYRLSGNSSLAEGALRENIVKMCRNKYAIEQFIRENPGQADIYRKLFTKYRDKFFYEPLKKESRQYIADMLGCSLDDIQIKSVSGNTSKALEEGFTIGHDLDVTFIYRSKDGKKLIELPQSIAEDALYKTGCKKAGFNFKSLGEAKEYAESLQLHACQPSDAERLPEVEKILDRYYRNAQLKPESIQKFKNAEMYKTYSMYEKSAETIKQLVPTKEEAAKLATKLDDILKGKAAAGDAERVLIDSVANMNDAYRAASKAGGLVTNKGIGAITVSGSSGLNSEFHTIMGVCNRVKTGDASFVRANRAFAQMGHNTESAFHNAFSQMEGVNKHLGVSNLMENVSIGASAAGSAMAGRSDSK